MKKDSKVTLSILHQLAKDLYFELDDQECHNLLLEFDAIEAQMAVVKNINTKNVKPLDFPFEITRDYLREDVIKTPLKTQDVLKVAGKTNQHYIVINQVITNEKN